MRFNRDRTAYEGLFDMRMIDDDCMTTMQRPGRMVDISGQRGVDD